MATSNTPDFHVALSFAGEDRRYVERVASALREMGLRVFYDKHEVASLWGKDLYTHLREVYTRRAMYTVMFISKHYGEKLWTNHERESAQARAFEEKREYILPARFDDTEVPGLLRTTHHVDLKEVSPEELARLIKEKIGPIERRNFFPEEPDTLYKELGAKDKRSRETIKGFAEHLFEALQLMTPEEREMLRIASLHTCPAGPPENIHLNLDYLARLSKRNRDEVLGLLSRLDCLGIQTRVREKEDEPIPDGVRGSSHEIVEIRFEPNGVRFSGNATFVLDAFFKVFDETVCSECGRHALEILDLSVLSTKTGLRERH